MKNIAIFICINLVSLMVCKDSIAQNEARNIMIESRIFPNPSIANFIWLNELSMSVWEEEMKQYSFDERKIGNGSINYSSGLKLKDGQFSVSKNLSGGVIFTWLDYYNRNSKFDAFLNELEPYYRGPGEKKGTFIYSFNLNGKVYEFLIVRTNVENTSGAIEMATMKIYPFVPKNSKIGTPNSN